MVDGGAKEAGHKRQEEWVPEAGGGVERLAGVREAGGGIELDGSLHVSVITSVINCSRYVRAADLAGSGG